MTAPSPTLGDLLGARAWRRSPLSLAIEQVIAVRSPRYSSQLTVGALVLTDLAALLLTFFSSLVLWAVIRQDPDVLRYASRWPLVLALLPVYLASGLYRVVGLNAVEELRRSVVATSLGFLIVAGASFWLKESNWGSRAVAMLTWLQACLLLPTMRTLLRRSYGPSQWFGHSVVVLGCGASARDLIRALQQNPGLGLKPVAVLAEDAIERSHVLGVPVLGGFELAPELAAQAGLHYAILASPGLARDEMIEAVKLYRDVFDNLLLVPDLLGRSSLWVNATNLGGLVGLEIHNHLLRRPARLLKRCMDIAIVTVSIPFWVPLFAVIAALVKLTSRGPLFYGHARLGLGSQKFKAWKFRTMKPSADALFLSHLATHPEMSEEWSRNQKLKRDPRLTVVGKLLRKTSLDELPQLFNVIRGEMSLVGPRPIVLPEVERYGEDFALYCRVKPGITGLWQVSGRNNTSYSERVSLDQYYVRNWSVWLDFYILKRTIKTVLTGEGAY